MKSILIRRVLIRPYGAALKVWEGVSMYGFHLVHVCGFIKSEYNLPLVFIVVFVTATFFRLGYTKSTDSI